MITNTLNNASEFLNEINNKQAGVREKINIINSMGISFDEFTNIYPAFGEYKGDPDPFTLNFLTQLDNKLQEYINSKQKPTNN